MRGYQFFTSLGMNFRMLLRRKIILILLIVIPSLFILMIQLTSSRKDILFRLGIDDPDKLIKAPEVDVALVFITMATIGFLSSFLALSLTQQYNKINRRLVICGYRPSEIILSGLGVMFVMIFIVAVCIGVCLLLFFDPQHSVLMLLGLLFAGITYGCYGMLIGSIVKRELEGVLLVIILANIDAGWLQNPLFFAEARNKAIIQLLPAYQPSQLAIASAFTNLPVRQPVFLSFAYMFAFLCLALCLFYYDMRVKSHVLKTKIDSGV